MARLGCALYKYALYALGLHGWWTLHIMVKCTESTNLDKYRYTSVHIRMLVRVREYVCVCLIVYDRM